MHVVACKAAAGCVWHPPSGAGAGAGALRRPLAALLGLRRCASKRPTGGVRVRHYDAAAAGHTSTCLRLPSLHGTVTQCFQASRSAPMPYALLLLTPQPHTLPSDPRAPQTTPGRGPQRTPSPFTPAGRERAVVRGGRGRLIQRSRRAALERHLRHLHGEAHPGGAGAVRPRQRLPALLAAPAALPVLPQGDCAAAAAVLLELKAQKAAACAGGKGEQEQAWLRA